MHKTEVTVEFNRNLGLADIHVIGLLLTGIIETREVLTNGGSKLQTKIRTLYELRAALEELAGLGALSPLTLAIHPEYSGGFTLQDVFEFASPAEMRQSYPKGIVDYGKYSPTRS